MGNVTKAELKVYAHPSNYSGYPDTHTFAISSKGQMYGNYGGIYDLSECKLVCNGNVYQTWLDKFMPNQTTSFSETGISFADNGVCHTYAMREILLCDEDLDTSSALGDDMCVAYYGKYGTGLSYLKTRLKESFAEAQKEEDLPNQLLDKVLARLSVNVSHETNSWISVMKSCFDIDVMKYYRNQYDRGYLERRIECLINKREALFDDCFDVSRRTLSGDFRARKRELYRDEFSTYMHDLARYGYFSNEVAEQFIQKFTGALRMHANACHLMALGSENR